MSIDISFPDEPPEDPMDGDYITFEAYADGKPVKCFITFDALLFRPVLSSGRARIRC